MRETCTGESCHDQKLIVEVLLLARAQSLFSPFFFQTYVIWKAPPQSIPSSAYERTEFRCPTCFFYISQNSHLHCYIIIAFAEMLFDHHGSLTHVTCAHIAYGKVEGRFQILCIHEKWCENIVINQQLFHGILP